MRCSKAVSLSLRSAGMSGLASSAVTRCSSWLRPLLLPPAITWWSSKSPPAVWPAKLSVPLPRVRNVMFLLVATSRNMCPSSSRMRGLYGGRDTESLYSPSVADVMRYFKECLYICYASHGRLEKLNDSSDLTIPALIIYSKVLNSVVWTVAFTHDVRHVAHH